MRFKLLVHTSSKKTTVYLLKILAVASGRELRTWGPRVHSLSWGAPQGMLYVYLLLSAWVAVAFGNSGKKINEFQSLGSRHQQGRSLCKVNRNHSRTQSPSNSLFAILHTECSSSAQCRWCFMLILHDCPKADADPPLSL